METRKRNRFIYYIFEYNLKSIHNKDYSVVKTFKVASYLSMMSLFFIKKKSDIQTEIYYKFEDTL